jgi:hypothetical protein
MVVVERCKRLHKAMEFDRGPSIVQYTIVMEDDLRVVVSSSTSRFLRFTGKPELLTERVFRHDSAPAPMTLGVGEVRFYRIKVLKGC